ncbi:MAG: HlyD family efflux transporter periplasmic adaptor subunit [Chitinophagales bacterium]
MEVKNISVWVQIIQLLRPYTKDIKNIIFFAAVNGIIYLSLPLGVQAIINLLFGGIFSTSLVVLIFIVVAGVLVNGWLTIFQTEISERVQRKIATNIGLQFAHKLSTIQVSEKVKKHLPEWMNRFFDASTVQKGLIKLLLDLPVAGIQLLFGLVLLAFYHPVFIAFGLALTAILLFILWLTSPKGLRTSLMESDHKYDTAWELEELARVSQQQGDVQAVAVVDQHLSHYLDARESHFRIVRFQHWVFVAFKVVMTSIMLIVGSYLLINQQLNIGQFIAAEIVIVTVLNSIEKIMSSLDTFYDLLTALIKINKVLQLPDNNAAPALITAPLVSLQKPFDHPAPTSIKRSIQIILVICLGVLFLPWTQNVRGYGKVTTLRPQQRPQELHSIIAGKIEKWYVREGQTVHAGDTILKIGEVKENYLDPRLLERTEEQIEAKERVVDNYRGKVSQIEEQTRAMEDARDFKLSQLENKISQSRLYIQSDSMALEAARTEVQIARDQFRRQQELYQQGLKSLTELEQRKQALQNTESKVVIAANKLDNARRDYANALIERNTIARDYQEKISKAQSEKFSTLSDVNSGEGELSKLKNQFAGYAIRNGFYFITAPQDGQITKTLAAGIGEVIKEGELLVRIVPEHFEYAAEMFIDPVDMPLIHQDQKVRFLFDGWPSIVFSGWPGLSYGTFGGRVVAIDNAISENGKFRILVAEDPQDQPWPKNLKLGGGAQGMALLKDVRLGYELWRKINGFPPDFYEVPAPSKKGEKK